MKEVKQMNDLIIYIIGSLSIIAVIGTVYLYINLSSLNFLLRELFSLVSRTFREYYKGEDMEPVLINGGIDIVWRGDVDGMRNENELGFITIYTNEGNINSPIKNQNEADIIAGKIIRMVYEYIKDKEDIQ